MKQQIKNWWIGETGWSGNSITYTTSDEPSPKECFEVVMFFVLPYCIFLVFLKKYFL